MYASSSDPAHQARTKWWSFTMLVAMLVSTLGAGLVTQQTSAAPIGQGFTLNASDLRFIRQQIRISENHVVTRTPTDPCAGLLGLGLNQVEDPTLPFGLRTVDGTCNNLQPGQAGFGAADLAFPRLTTAQFRDAEPVPPLFGPAAGQPTSYNDANNSNALGPGSVVDSQPRTISNLIVDQTPNNPAAVDAAGPGAPVDPDTQTIFIKNVAPDEGLSAPFNSWFTLFGQFFDHGLDLVTKGGAGTVFIPLQADDPLIVGPDRLPGTPDDPPAPPSVPFMMVTRASTQPSGAREGTNTTTPFVDQNQTYTSHPSHQVFLRAYDFSSGAPVPTGKLLDGAIAGNIASWSETKAMAVQLGIALDDQDVFNVPLLVTDPYGHFIPGPNGFPQIMFPGNVVIEGNPLSPVDVSGALKTGHAFLDDIAHNAVPDTFDHDSNPATPRIPKAADSDSDISTAGQPQPAGTYDNELLDRHFVTGDGRGNENIGLTAVHSVFHAEHNRLVDDINNQINSLLTPDEIADWQAVNPATGWGYGERLFQAARFVTEMEYQHLVFEEFGRKIQPQINIFSGYDTGINPAISAEFAHTVYRFGHSMLTETVDRQLPDGTRDDMDLFDAFLNPVAFNEIAGQPVDGGVAMGSIAQAMTQQVGNEIDEFVTDALRNRLVGLPLDLAAINMARARSEGIPPLNVARAQFYAASGDPILIPYTSWADFSFNLKNQASLVNFVAAYGQHPDILAETTVTGKRAAAQTILDGPLPGPDGVRGDNPLTINADESVDDTPAGPGLDLIFFDDPLTPGDESADNTPADPGPDGILGDNPATTNADESLDDIGPDDALDFMLSTGAWASAETGLNLVDFWVGGLAEAKAPFGGMLGSTFNYVFETQMERLQDGDRFYYLSRTSGLNLLVQLEGNSFAELIMRNSSARGLPADVFSRPDYSFNVSKLGTSGAILDDTATPDWFENQLLTRNIPTLGTIRFGGAEHVNWNGNDPDENVGLPSNDRLFSGLGDDTIRLNGGNDWAEGGAGNDQHIGGLGDDILNDSFGDDVLKGGPGDDAMASGQGFDLNQGGTGDDFVVGGSDPTETFGGPGDDVIYAGASFDTIFGDDGDDWIEGGGQADLLQGDNGAPFQNDPNQPGNDVIIGDGGNDDYDAEGGDDIMVAGDGIERNEGMLGFDWVTYKGDIIPADADFFFTGLLPPTLDANRDRFDQVEGLSGWNLNDKLRGTNDDVTVLAPDHVLNTAGIARIQGLADILPVGATSFADGNIILGGAGSDLLEGRGGNDILDGDRWLNVLLSNGTAAADSLHTFRAAVFAGTLDPGTLDIIRRLENPGPGTDVDTALFSDVRAAYTITANGDGSITVSHDNAGVDGVDTLWNIEQGQFADGIFQLSTAVNIPATGAPTFSNLNPTETLAVTALTTGIVDGNGLPATFSFQWQQNNAPNGAAFVNIAGATNASFTPGAAQVNRRLRVVVSFTDLDGYAESVTSAQSNIVGDLFNGGGGGDNFTGTAGNDIASGGNGGDTLNMGGGDDIASGDAGADSLTGGAGADTLDGGAGNDTINGGAGIDILIGGAATDTMNGGADNDFFRFANGFGNDTINNFDFNPAGGQDLLDISAIGVTSANFATRVTIANGGGGRTLITVRNAAAVVQGTIRLNGGPANYSITDFILAP